MAGTKQQGLLTSEKARAHFGARLEAIAGDIAPANSQFETQATQREDGSWLFDGAVPIDEFKETFKVRSLPGDASYQTLAGFILFYLGLAGKCLRVLTQRVV